jgi:hypothetical protein
MQTFTNKLQRISSLSKDFISDFKLSKSLLLGITVMAFFNHNESKAQFTLTGQIKPRTEFRDGFGTLQQKGQESALHISQRTRLNVGYTGYRFKTFLALQDVRVWGQDRSSLNRTTVDAYAGLKMHEAWGELILIDTISKIKNLSLKVGRQEISYDDQKVLGSLDWLQQARSHDAIVLKYANKSWIADFGVAFNQNSEKMVGTIYDGVPAPNTYPAGSNGIGTMYKSFQYAYIAKKFYFGDVSFLFFKDDFNKYTSAGTGANIVKTPIEGVWSRNTTGLFYNINATRKINLTGSYYYQGGKDKDGKELSAHLASVTGTYQASRKLFLGAGLDFLSGTDGTKAVTADSKINQFDPLYGTPHKFWGYMDYFYVANGFGRQGLMNYFLKAKYNATDKLQLFADLHRFDAANKVSNGPGGEQNKNLGTELDLKLSYNFTKLINIEAGYSYMKATKTMASAQVKNVTNADLSPQWAYVTLLIKPDFLSTKKQ